MDPKVVKRAQLMVKAQEKIQVKITNGDQIVSEGSYDVVPMAIQVLNFMLMCSFWCWLVMMLCSAYSGCENWVIFCKILRSSQCSFLIMIRTCS